MYKRSSFKKTALLIILLLMGLICVDIIAGTAVNMVRGKYFGYEVSNGVRNLNSYYNHGFVSGSSGIIEYGPLSPRYFINSLGMKDASARNVPLFDKKYRILFLGDSFTEGIGYPWDSTFCGLLATRLDSSTTEILNAGVAGCSPKTYYLRADYLLNVQKLVVNDVYCFLDYSDVFDELVYEDFVPKIPTTEDERINAVMIFYRRHSIIYNLYCRHGITTFLKQNKLPDGYGSLYWTKSSDRFCSETNFDFADFHQNWLNTKMFNQPVTQRALVLTKGNILKLRDLLHQHGVKFHLVIYPNSRLVSDGKYKPAEVITKDNKKYIKMWRDFAQQNGIDFINLFPLFVSDNPEEAVLNRMEYYIPGDIHWNFEGHKKVADSLFAAIAAKGI